MPGLQPQLTPPPQIHRSADGKVRWIERPGTSTKHSGPWDRPTADDQPREVLPGANAGYPLIGYLVEVVLHTRQLLHSITFADIEDAGEHAVDMIKRVMVSEVMIYATHTGEIVERRWRRWSGGGHRDGRWYRLWRPPNWRTRDWRSLR